MKKNDSLIFYFVISVLTSATRYYLFENIKNEQQNDEKSSYEKQKMEKDR